MSISVLVADDQPEIRNLVTFMLEADGRFMVSTALNGTEALEACTADPPDILLIDGMMPDMDGFSVCEILKSNEATSSISVVMLSALTQRQNLDKAFEVGVSGYVTKPFTMSQLVAGVVTAVESRAS